MTELGLKDGYTGIEAEVNEILRYLTTYKLPACLRKRFLAAFMMFLKKEGRYFESNEIFDHIYFIEEDEEAIIEELIFTSDFYF